MALTSFLEKKNEEKLIKEWVFDQPAVNIGSHLDNDIVLDGADIQPFHTVMLLHGDEFRLIPLSAEAVIHLDDIPFTDTVIPVNDDQEVEIGPYKLSVRQVENTNQLHVTVFRALPSSPSETGFNAVPAGLDQPMQAWDAQSLTSAPEILSTAPLSPPSGRPALAPDDRIQDALQVNLVSQYAEIDVEQSALFVFEVVNVGVIVDHFQVAVHGVPHAWVQISTPKVQLLSGERATLQISLTPPRAPTSRAGKHRFEVLFTSPNYPGQQFTVEKELTIRPYYRFAVNNLQPQRQAVYWHKRFAAAALPITNLGNSDTDFSITAVDEENGCRFDFIAPNGARLNRHAVINIPAGETFTLPLEVSPRKQPAVAFSNPRYPYSTTVQVADQNMPPQMLSGTATYYPLLGWVSILLLTLTLLAGLFFLLQPRIYSFQVTAGKDVIELGDTTRLEWAVSPFASAVNISNVDQPLSRGQTSLTISPSQSTTYSLTSGNWLSDLFRLGYKLTQTVLVIPPTPQINVFEVDQTSVAKGKPVNLRWSVVKADQVFLTIDEVVYELSKEEFSGERPVVLEKDALVILEARSASGSELRSYFINVVPPAITVQAFTIWVRPAVQAAVQSSPAKLAALTYAPDPNFPEKFVELVPDSASEIGYRVEFYQPERELQKGEQVIVEWNVIGADNEKLTIAPFEEELPARGSQPFFPQESMNFVMTAKSGELERLFMLPVKVFDGEPPQPPKIEFFKASPVKMTGAGDVQFAWSVSGEWTRVQIASGDQVTADYLNPQGFKTVRVPKSATFILTAWNGSLSSAAPVEVTVDPALIPLTLQIKSVYPTSGRFLIGDKLAVTVEFTDVPADKPDPTGKIIVTDGFSNCTITLPAVTCDLTFTTPGIKSITASYEGDKIYLQADSDPYPGTISVASLSVNLDPAFFYLNTAGTGPGAVIDLANTPLKLDQGLYIKVNVKPVNTVLVDDQKGKVTISVCDQELINGLPVAKVSTCVFTGTATVTKSTVDNEFYADLILKNFPSAGTRVLLFEYRHDANAISPASYTQTDVKVNEMGLYLSLPLCLTNPDTFSGCEVGVTDASKAKITFDIKKGDNKSLLSSVMPAPVSAAFNVYDLSVAPQKDWTCSVITKNSTYKLDCTANFTGLKDVNWLYSFTDAKDPNYSFAAGNNGFSAPFYLKVVESTSLILSIPANMKAGESIRLAGPSGTTVRYVQIVDSQGNPIDPAGGLRLSDDDPANSGAYVITSASNCTMDAATGDILIPSVTAPCEIFFKSQGTYQLTVAYLGDNNNYAPSSSSTQVNITKQTGFMATWKYQESGIYKDWGTLNAWAKDTPLPIRITFADAPRFVAESLVGMTLKVTIKNGATPITAADCTSPSVTNGVHQAAIARYPVSPPTSPVTYEVAAQFTLTCVKTPMRLTLELVLADTANFDFMAPESRQLLITQNSQGAYGFGLTVEMVRSPGGQSVVLASPDRLDTIFVGETYLLTVRAETIFDYFDTLWNPSGPQSLQDLLNRYANLRAYLDLPDYLANRVDTVNSTCPVSSDPAYDIEIPLQNTNSTGNEYSFDWFGTIFRWGYADIRLRNDSPCTLVFTTGSQDTSTTAATFSFSAASNFLGVYSDNNTYGTSGLRRQNVTLAPLAFSGFVSETKTIVFNLTREIATNPLLPLNTAASFDSQFAISLPSTCAVTRDTSLDSVNSATQAQFGLTLPAAGCSGDITITYNGNSYFNSLTQNVSITVNKHAAQFGALTYKQGANLVAFPPATVRVSDSFELHTTVSDADVPAHTLIPGGTVEVFLADSAGNPLANTAYTITQAAGGGAVTPVSNRYTVALSATGEAFFNLNLLTANANVSLRYTYTGSALFNATTQQSSAVFSVTTPPPPPGP